MYAQYNNLCQFGLLSQAYQPISPSILIHFRWELYQINSLIVQLQANQSNQLSIQRELLMPSPEVFDLTLSDDETQPDPVRSNQDTSTPSPLATETSLKAYFPHLSLKFETI